MAPVIPHQNFNGGAVTPLARTRLMTSGVISTSQNNNHQSGKV